MSSDNTEQARIEEIKKLFEEYQLYRKHTLDVAIELGKLLSAQKKVCGHGNFKTWVAGHLPFSHMTATKYMRMYKHRRILKSKGPLSLNTAYEENLRERKPTPTEPEAPAARQTGTPCIQPIAAKPPTQAEKDRADLRKIVDRQVADLKPEEMKWLFENWEYVIWPMIERYLAKKLHRREAA